MQSTQSPKHVMNVVWHIQENKCENYHFFYDIFYLLCNK